MVTNEQYGLHDFARMRKVHPCGSDTWEIVRLGAEIRLKCCGCGHVISLPRGRFNRAAKAIVTKETEKSSPHVQSVGDDVLIVPLL